VAAPALAASIAETAICCGVTGTAELRPGVSAEPVTAHEIITLRCMGSPNAVDQLSNARRRVPRAGMARYIATLSYDCWWILFKRRPLADILRMRSRVRFSGGKDGVIGRRSWG